MYISAFTKDYLWLLSDGKGNWTPNVHYDRAKVQNQWAAKSQFVLIVHIIVLSIHVDKEFEHKSLNEYRLFAPLLRTVFLEHVMSCLRLNINFLTDNNR